MTQVKREHRQPIILNDSTKHSLNESLLLSVEQASTKNSEKSDYQKDQKIRKTRCRLTACQVSSTVCLLIAFLVVFALPPLMQRLIVQQAVEQTIMKPSNQGLWAHFPGETETIILRNFTFFKLDNQGEFLFHGQKPVFREISEFKIQELEDFLNIEYLEEENLVKVRDWLRFAEWAESKNLDQKVSILNMGNIGYWSTLKAARPTLLLQQGLALLFTNLEESLIPMLLGSGISQQFLPNASLAFSNLLSPAGIGQENLDFMWKDPVYGLSDSSNLGYWAQAAVACFQNADNTFVFSQKATILKNYFVISDSQLKSLMDKVYSYVATLRRLLLENHYCTQIEMQECTGRYLAIAQLADGWVTGNTPPVSTISANDSICDNNSTCYGKYPQPYAFAKNKFTISQQFARRVNNNGSESVTFPREAVLSWFNYNHSIQQGLDYNTACNCLLHIGNLDDLWELGMSFQQNHDTLQLQKIRVRFGLRSNAEAQVFWRWILYFTHEFVLQNYGNANLGLANVFTSGFYQHFSFLQDNLQPFLLAQMLKQALQKTQCRQFFENALEEHDNSSLIGAICRNYGFNSDDFAAKMIDICENKYGKEWKGLRQIGVTLFSMEAFCDLHSQGSVGSFIHFYKLKLDQLYGCKQTPNPYCSNFQLALMQWQDSTITLNPPISSLTKNTSFSAWQKQAKSIEYQHFISLYFPNQKDSFPRFKLSQLFSLFNFQHLFSTNLLVKQLGQQSLDPYFYKYIRYVSIFITLNGFTTTRTVREFLFGYEDQYLAGVKKSYPPFGGDPSAPSIISFNDLNYTKEEVTQTIVFKTGKDDFRNVYQNYEINGYKYLVNNYTWFNGNESVWAWKSPWAEKDYFHGTTAKVFAPNQFQADNISMLILQVQRYGGNHFHNQTEKIERYGAEIYLAHLTAAIGEVNQENAKYYQTIPNVFNVSSIYGLPLYVTKNHFLNATEWLKLVDIYNEDKSIHYKDVSEYDDSFVIVEPYTGASFQSCVYLQNNYLHKQDPLYDYPNDTMLPIFSVWRSGNLTEEKYREIYAPLIMAFAVKSSLIYVGIGLFVLATAGLIWSSSKKRRMVHYQPSSPLFGSSESLENYHFASLEEQPESTQQY